MNRIELGSLIKSNRPNDLKEWVDYHLAIGVDRITFFDNGSEFSVEDLFKTNDRIEVIRTPGNYGYSGVKNQCELYHKFYNRKINQTDWLSTIDDDEFIYIKSGKNVKEVLNDDLSVICMFWKMISLPEVLETRSSTLIDTFNYTSFSSPWAGRVFVKSVVNLKKCVTISWNTPHLPTFNCKRQGQTLEGIQIYDDFLPAFYDYNNQNMILYHYYHQSYQDRIWKVMRCENSDTQPGRPLSRSDYNSEIVGKYKFLDNNMINRKKELGL
jgi:hypothetical protein